MKKIVVSKLKKDLEKYDVNQTTKDMIINNVSLYNDLINEYKNDNKSQSYLMYQLNMQIFKQLTELNKLANRQGGDSDDFTDFINNLKKKKETR